MRLVPDRQLVAVVLDLVGVGPPDLVVGGGQHPAQLGAGDGAADGDVDVRGQAPLGFDGGEVLHVVAEVAAQVLDEPVEQRGEGQRVPARSPGPTNPHASPTRGSRSWTLTGPQLADVFVTLSPRLTASSALTSTGPTPRASTSGSARPWSCARNGAISLRHRRYVHRSRAPDYEP